MRARQGDAAAREQLVALHLPLVRHVARRFIGFGRDLDDLVQAGTLGLLQAIDGFDPERGYQFSTYAVPVVVGEIRRFLRDSDPVGLGRAQRARVAAIRRAAALLEQELERHPTADEIARRLGCDVAEVVFALEGAHAPVSLDAPVGEEPDADPRLARVGNEASIDWSDVVAVREALSQLPPRLRTIVTLRFFRDRTQAEVALVVGLSQPQVSRLERLALAELRRRLSDSQGARTPRSRYGGQPAAPSMAKRSEARH